MIWSVLSGVVVALAASFSLAQQAPASIEPLKIAGEHYVDPAGKPVRFWGVNLVSFYPAHEQADALAANLAARQINLVRPHHLLRASRDWNPSMPSGSLLTYDGNSRRFDEAALDRFDYLNAALKRNGIYLAFSTHFSRTFLPGDVDILKTDDADRVAWEAAMTELNGYDWKKSIDLKKMLPTIDERAALLSEEFTRNLVTHKNPYTGTTYAEDPQVISFEIVNESSAEYAIVCGNKFPEYWQRKLLAKWDEYARAAGVEPGDLYGPSTPQMKSLRARFLRSLDEQYFDRMKATLRQCGSAAPVTYSNLWRGENNLQMHAERADFIEAHMYGDPLVTRAADDWIAQVARTALAGKPFIIGELNQAEGAKNIAAQSPQRSMLPLAAASYGSLHNWSGLIWFAWIHGGEAIADDGWAKSEGRESKLGSMIEDGMQIDHLRTTGIIFRRGLVAPSKAPITLAMDEPLTAANYGELMRGKTWIKHGWQGVHGVRKAFGAAPEQQAKSAWMTDAAPSPIASDTGQIIKDTKTQQLIVAAPQVEGFSGPLSGATPSALRHLSVHGEGFATVIVVSDDGVALSQSQRLIVSRTALDAQGKDTASITVKISGLRAEPSRKWYCQPARSRGAAVHPIELAADAQGAIALPATDWHECELSLK